MRSIQFTNFGFSNFKKYQDPVNIHIDPGKMTLISGKNGSGKTTIFDSVFFSLYGYTSKGCRSKSVVNEKIHKNCYTWIEWIDDKDTYRIDRYVSHSKFGNTVILYRNKIKIGVGQKEVNRIIDNILIPKNLFTNTVFFPQKTKSFFTDLTDTEQKQIFRKILDLDELVTYQKETILRIDTTQKKIVKIENEISTLIRLVEELRNQKESYINDKKIFESDKKNEILKIKKLIEDYKKLLGDTKNSLEKIKLDKAKKRKLDVENELQNNEVILSDLNSEIQSLNLTSKQSLLDKKEELQDIINNKSKIIKDNGYNNISKISIIEYPEEVQYIKDQINKLSNQLYSIPIQTITNQLSELQNSVFLKDKCPTCGTDIHESSRKIINSKISNLKNQESNYKKNILILKKKIGILEDKAKSKLLDYESEKNNIQRRINEIKNEIKDNVNKIKENAKKNLLQFSQNVKLAMQKKSKIIYDKINEIKQKNEYAKRMKLDLENVIEQYNILSSRKNQLKSNISIYKTQLDDLQSRKFDISKIDNIAIKINDYQNNISDLRAILRQLHKNVQIYQFWKEGFSKNGIESMLIDECLPFINSRIREYQDIISDGRYIISFDTLTETKSGDIRDKTNISVLDTETLTQSKDVLSGGQERLIDISVILTLADLQCKFKNISFNILLFDEIFDSLDSQSISKVCKVLKILSKKNKSIFVISHRDIDQIEFDSVLEM